MFFQINFRMEFRHFRYPKSLFFTRLTKKENIKVEHEKHLYVAFSYENSRFLDGGGIQ